MGFLWEIDVDTIYERIKYLIGQKQKFGIDRLISESFDRGKITNEQRVELKILFQDLESEFSLRDIK